MKILSRLSKPEQHSLVSAVGDGPAIGQQETRTGREYLTRSLITVGYRFEPRAVSGAGNRKKIKSVKF